MLKTWFSALKEKNRLLQQRRQENTARYPLTNRFLLCFFPVFIVCMAELNQGKYPSKFILFFAEHPSIMLFNFMIAALIFSGLLFLFKKGWIATLTQSVLYMALSIVELFKYGTNGNHLILTDMRLAKNINNIKSFAYIKITPWLVSYVLIVAAFCLLVAWFNPCLKKKLGKRILPAICCLTACFSVVTVPSLSSTVYTLFNVDTTAAENTFRLNEKFDHNGFLAFFLQTASENLANRLEEPEHYDEEVVDAYLDVEIQEEEISTRPNVIVIMSEAFADFRRFDQLEIDESVYSGFDAVAEQGYCGTAIVPTFASFTVRTEFELLFGLPVRSLNDPNMPQRLLQDREQPTIVSYYKEQLGYSTAYVHPFVESFYSRNRVYANFGFDQMIFEDDFTVDVDYYGTYISDQTVFHQMEQLITETEAPMYIHATTMQNHQPYDQGENPDAEVDNYLQWIGYSMDCFETFIHQLDALEEPTVVFFVGDHYPSLKGEDSLYDQLGMNGDNCTVLYEQPYLIWSNYDLDYSNVPETAFSTFYAPYVLIDLLDLPRDSFIQNMLEKLQTLPVYSTNYDPDAPRDEELDILTYDRVLGENISGDEP